MIETPRQFLEDMSCKPYYLHLELTNICNSNCVFCAYSTQQRRPMVMPDHIFEKAVRDFVAEGGGGVSLTPIVGDALIDPAFLDRVKRLRAEPKIDRMLVITNGILLDRFGIPEIVRSGLSFLAISLPGFDAETYERVYRSRHYRRVRDNILAVLAENERAGRPITKISLLLRTDRSYEELLQCEDFQEMLKFSPSVQHLRSFSSFSKRISAEQLPQGMNLFFPPTNGKQEPCMQLYAAPTVLPDGKVIACGCFQAMDAFEDLGIGDIAEHSLGDIWRGRKMQQLRDDFRTGMLNRTCRDCDMYQNLDAARSEDGRVRAELNRLRKAGGWARRTTADEGFWLPL